MGTVCSGILGAELAAPDHWEAAWCAEIDPFASRVIAHHRPELRNYGDFTTIGTDAGPVDILCGGTPCQSFSTSGSRGGMDDSRGELSLEFARLANRVNARWILWENVPGVLSSGGGRDFGIFLGSLVECGYHLSYRILDACFFGLAQRRRRVWVVGYLGDWRPPAAVLFESPRLRGDYEKGGPSIRPRGTVFAEGVPATAGGQCEVSTTIRAQTVSRTLTRSIGRAIQEKMETYVSHTVSSPSRLLIEGSGSFISHDTSIRKLTPLEYERLQGFPEGWTKIPKSSDSARYKVLGNAWPVNVARWIMARIDTVNEVIQ